MKQLLKWFIIPVLLGISIQTIYSQNNVSVQWLTNSMGNGWNVVSDIHIANDGYIYLIGNYSDSTCLGTKKTFGQDDLFIVRYSPDGIANWQQHINTEDYCHVSTIITDKDGNFYLGGYFRNQFKLGEFEFNAEKTPDMFIARLDTSGNVDFVTRLKGDFRARKILLHTFIDNSLLVACSYNNKVEVNDSIFVNNYIGSDILMFELDIEGNLQKSCIIGGEGEDIINDMFIDSTNCIYTSFSFEKNINFNNRKIVSNGKSDALLLVMDKEFNMIFKKQLGGIYNDFGMSVKLDNDNNIVFIGSHSGEMMINETIKMKTVGGVDVFICKYDINGKLLWADNFGGKANDFISSAAINSYNDIYLFGNFRGEINKINNIVNSKGFSHDIFLAKYSTDGQFKFIETLGDTNTDIGRKIIIDAENNILLTGNFNETMKVFEKSTDQTNKLDFFLTKLFDCNFATKPNLTNDTCLCGGSYTIIADTGYTNYFWNESIGGNTFSIDTSGVYYLQVADKHGCITTDSVKIRINIPIEVDLGDDLRVYQGEMVTLFAGTGFEEYLWNNKDIDTGPFLQLYTGDMIPGIYMINVQVTDTNHCTNSDELKLEVIGPDEKETVQIVYYPNPVKDYFLFQVINLKPQSRFQLQLISLEGTLIWNEEYQVKDDYFEQHINLQQLNPGAYYLRMKYDDGVKVLRVVKM